MDAALIEKLKADIGAAIQVLEPLHGRGASVIAAFKADLTALEALEKTDPPTE